MPEPSHQRIDTKARVWIREAPGVERLHLASGVGMRSHDIAVLRLAAGASLPPPPEGCGLEVLVLDGTWHVPEGTLAKHGYARRPEAHVGTDTCATGATLFVRSGPFAANDVTVVHHNPTEHEWLPGQGNLRVKPLHSIEDEGTAFVHWPAGERFPPHRHWGGEEIFVLSGTFEDEHGRYPSGTWMLSPHLSAHHPFVTEETLIFVKTGHLPQD